jgi:hypothetical protein
VDNGLVARKKNLKLGMYLRISTDLVAHKKDVTNQASISENTVRLHTVVVISVITQDIQEQWFANMSVPVPYGTLAVILSTTRK